MPDEDDQQHCDDEKTIVAGASEMQLVVDDHALFHGGLGGEEAKTRGTSCSSRTSELEVREVGEAELVDVGHVLVADLGVRIRLVLVNDTLDVPPLKHARNGYDTAGAMLFWESAD